MADPTPFLTKGLIDADSLGKDEWAGDGGRSMGGDFLDATGKLIDGSYRCDITYVYATSRCQIARSCMPPRGSAPGPVGFTNVVLTSGLTLDECTAKYKECVQQYDDKPCLTKFEDGSYVEQ
jgi:hypothetical protein